MGVTAETGRLHPENKKRGWKQIMLIIKYERKDFWGQIRYTEDRRETYTREDVKKAFLFLGKNYDAALQKENVIYSWGGLADYENKNVRVHVHIPGNDLIIERNAKTFEDAVVDCVDILKDKLVRAKEKKTN